MMADKVLLDEEYDGLAERRKEMIERMSYLEGLLDDYKLYEPYIKNHKEQWALKGIARKKYERQHMGELYRYDFYRAKIKDVIICKESIIFKAQNISG
ncbi:MAG: hypothetical protein IKR56_01955 [Lachnospiraceae bacterium]|nr:hypothetical protein [Lachnospiraceae bacterium]